MKRLFIITFLLLPLFYSCNLKEMEKQSKDGKINAETKDALYAVGMLEGERISQLDPSDKELEIILEGIADTIKGNAKLSGEKYIEARKNISKVARERVIRMAARNKEEGKAYIEKYSKKDGVVVSESGLAYKIINEGGDAKPLPADQITVEYTGKLLDGTVFDSSENSKKEVKFYLNRVVKGWTEGLQLIGEGGEIELVIPSDLAYGDRGNNKIAPGSTLIFEVKLNKIIKTPAKK